MLNIQLNASKQFNRELLHPTLIDHSTTHPQPR